MALPPGDPAGWADGRRVGGALGAGQGWAPYTPPGSSAVTGYNGGNGGTSLAQAGGGGGGGGGAGTGGNGSQGNGTGSRTGGMGGPGGPEATRTGAEDPTAEGGAGRSTPEAGARQTG